jgi:hypothetical protein
VRDDALGGKGDAVETGVDRQPVRRRLVRPAGARAAEVDGRLRKNSPISSGAGGVTAAIGVERIGISTTRISAETGWRATISSARRSPRKRP